MARIILGITGSIVAYKGAELARALVKRDHQVRALLTAGGQKFITPLTLQALTGHPVPVDQWQGNEPDGLDHIHLARWADLLVVAPATADYMAKAAHGIADDLLTTVALAFDGPVFIAPAMNTRMLEHAATRSNLAVLKERGVHILEAEEGELVCGEHGSGRMVEIDYIADTLCTFLADRLDYSGVSALVTAGPTVEPLDPVRIFTNRSSGRMGFAVARALSERGAMVKLISGPTTLNPPEHLAEVVFVDTTAEMAAAVNQRFDDADLLIMAAAVADWRPAEPDREKGPRAQETRQLRLEPTEDILEALSPKKGKRVIVGFALETDDQIARGRAKLKRKGLDVIAVNDPTEPGAGPMEETNRLTLIHSDGRVVELPMQSKEQIAHRLLDAVHVYMLNSRSE